MSERPKLWSHEETADFLGIPARTLYFMNHKGTAPRSYKVGRYRRYAPADVLAWLESLASTSEGASS